MLAGDWPITILALWLGALFMVAVGLLVGGFFRNTVQVNTWSSIIMLALVAPSWFVSPNRADPLVMVMRLIPTYYLTEALQLSLAGEAAPLQVWGNLAILAGSVVVVLAAVVWTLRREEK